MTRPDPKAERITRLRARTADRPAHARLLEILLALEDDRDGQDEDYAAGAMRESGRALSSLAAQALIEDTNWIRHYGEPLANDWNYSVFPNAYDNYRVASARAASARKRTIERGGDLSDLLRI